MSRLWIAVLVLVPAVLSAEPRIVYSKHFPGSKPEFVEITLGPDGKAVYKESADDELPLKFALSKNETDTIFLLAGKLEHFKKTLESGLAVAKMGEKTFRWVDGTETHEAKFNYTQDLDGQAMLEWFEKMSLSVQHYIDLERAVKFEKLGTNRALLKLQASIDRGRVVALEQFLPLLDRVRKNDTYLNMDRERAAAMAEAIRNPKPTEEKAAAQ